MPNEHLAIASVPIQPLGELYDDAKALETGTIFQNLDMPFYATDAGKGAKKAEPKTLEQQEREDLMRKVSANGFVLDDLILYLDTHEDDKEACRIYLQKCEERKALKKEFAQRFYPLTRDCIPDTEPCCASTWKEGPAPWEGACV